MKNDTIIVAMTAIVGIVGSSRSGKTELIVKLVELFSKKGIRTGTIKHARHGALDTKGKDSYRHFQAGAEVTLLATDDAIQLVKRTPAFDLRTAVETYFPDCELVIVEGFKNADMPKIEVYRQAVGKPPLFSSLSNVIAVATDTNIPGIHCLPLNDPAAIALFIIENILKNT